MADIHFTPIQLPKTADDISGKKFNHLTAVAPVGKDRHANICWLFACSCGDHKVAVGAHVKRGVVKSCGCKSTLESHGRTETDEYRIWCHMICRCHNKADISYHNYGGRGISVCDEWRKSFLSFYNHVGDRPSKSHSIDRIDSSKNYEPGNCRWATRKEQSRNTRRNHFITANGMTMCIAEWAEATGIGPQTIYKRISTYGWSPEKAVTTPVMGKKHG